MASRRVARVGLATTKVGEGAGAAVVGERRREKRRQERKRKIFWTKKCTKISVLYNSYLRLHGDPCWSTAVA